VILGTVDSSFAKNKIDGNATSGTAVFVGGNNVNLAITGNTVTNAGTRGIRFNTQLFPGFPPSAPSIYTQVTKNVIEARARPSRRTERAGFRTPWRGSCTPRTQDAELRPSRVRSSPRRRSTAS
jgi:hypothetical protein